jgi:hypothetical protein
MTIAPRTLLASVVASAVLGGAVGALATAATTSQASPTAIAAAVQKVRDVQAESRLATMQTTLEAINVDLGGTGTNPAHGHGMERSVHDLLKELCDDALQRAGAPLGCY